MNKIVYLDHNATTPVDPAVLEAMLPYLTENFGNASSVHAWGTEGRYGVEKARMQLASLVGASEDNIVFTSCGSESNNTVLNSVARKFEGKGCHVICSAIEHPAVYRCLDDLAKRGLVTVTYIIPQSSGAVASEDFEKAIQPDTRLFSLMYANNEMGAIQPVKEICAIARERGILTHSDSIQAIGKIPFNVSEIGLDFATFSGHKIYAPKGIGAYYVKDKSLITPLLHGGGQEMKLRPGTESVPMIAGLGAAAELCAKNLSAESAGLAEMRVRLEEALRREIEGVVVCAEGADRLPGTSCVCFEGVYGTYVVLDLADEGIAVSSGSACSANKSEPSHVLLAMGMEPEVAQGAVRFSLGRANTPDQIDVVVEKVAEIVQKQRAHPPQLELDIDLLSICD